MAWTSILDGIDASKIGRLRKVFISESFSES